MQVTGNFFWMQSAAWQKTGTRVNPLLEKAQHAIAQRNTNASASGPVSKEMAAKIRQNTTEAKVDPNDKLVRQKMEELMFAEQDYYRELGLAKLQLTGLVRQQDEYTGILDGTADYDRAFRNIYTRAEDRERFDFADFKTYLDANGYQQKALDGSEPIKLVEVPAEYGGTKVLFDDQVQLYEQWQADKQAHRMEQLKAYAAEQLPQVQERIEAFASHIDSIGMRYGIKRAEILAELPEGLDMGEYGGNVDEVDGFLEDMRSIDPADGKKVLALLNQILETQRNIVLGLGGAANHVFDGTLGGTPSVPSFRFLDANA